MSKITNQPDTSSASAAVSRHLAFLGKALGKEGAVSDVLPARLTEASNNAAAPSMDPLQKGHRDEGAVRQAGGQPAAAAPGGVVAGGALARLRQRVRNGGRPTEAPAPRPLHTPRAGVPVDQAGQEEELGQGDLQEDGAEDSAPSLWDAQASAPPDPSSDDPHLGASQARAVSPVPSDVKMADSPAPSTYKPWGGSVAAAGQEGKGIQSANAAKPLSAVDRLRMTARGMAPKRLESRDHDSWLPPFVEGGAKVPLNYPDLHAWPDDERPPGSLHEAKAWWRARTGLDDQAYELYQGLDEVGRKEMLRSGQAAWVIEIMGAQGSVLMRIPKNAQERADATGMGEFFGQVFDQCLLVMQDGKPAFSGAAEPKKHQHGDQSFWVIRPRSHYLQAWTQTSLFCNAKWSSSPIETSDGGRDQPQDG